MPRTQQPNPDVTPNHTIDMTLNIERNAGDGTFAWGSTPITWVPANPEIATVETNPENGTLAKARCLAEGETQIAVTAFVKRNPTDTVEVQLNVTATLKVTPGPTPGEFTGTIEWGPVTPTGG